MALNKLGVKSGDTVVVISGKDKGKQGKIQKAFPATGKVIVQGVAMVKKHQKPRGQGMPGGIIAKAHDEFHGRMLEKLGADQVLFPERDMGRRVAHKIGRAHV